MIKETFEITPDNLGCKMVGLRIRKLIINIQCLKHPKFFDWFTKDALSTLTPDGIVEVKCIFI
jgi:hypothetical protein